MDAHHLMVLIGRIDTIKYKMIWMGGLIGIILGFSNRIMNLCVLKEALPAFYTHLYEHTDQYNNIHPTSRITIFKEYFKMENEGKEEIMCNWFLFSFLNYYINIEVRHFLRKYLLKPIEYLKFILNNICIKCELEVLDFLELTQIYPPIDFTLREKVENQLFQGHSLKFFLECIKENTSDSHNLKSLCQECFHIVEKQSQELELKKIVWGMGQFILAQSDMGEKPILININEIIGRKFY